MAAVKKDFEILIGSTWGYVIRWGTTPIVRKPITDIDWSLGAPRLSVSPHGLSEGWGVAVYGVKSPRQINAANNPPEGSDYHSATVIDTGTIELNDVTPVDENGQEWPAYTSGGFIQYDTPVDLTGYTARMSIKDKIGGTVLHSLTTENGGIDIDPAAKTIALSIPAADTEDFTWSRGVYDLEMVSSAGKVTRIISGRIALSREVTT